jgi:hypothetical protein
VFSTVLALVIFSVMPRIVKMLEKEERPPQERARSVSLTITKTATLSGARYSNEIRLAPTDTTVKDRQPMVIPA